MRSRYYNPDIKRFINQDVLIGSIGNSNSLNRYSYVEGNPVSYTDPFGLSPFSYLNMFNPSVLIHTTLDVLGCLPGGSGFDLVNAAIYFLEGNDKEGWKSLIFAIPGMDLAGKGMKWGAKIGGKGGKILENTLKAVDMAGHLKAIQLSATDFGNDIAFMIDKYMVGEAEWSSETAWELVSLAGHGFQLKSFSGSFMNNVNAGTYDSVIPGMSTANIDLYKVGDWLSQYDFIGNRGGTNFHGDSDFGNKSGSKAVKNWKGQEVNIPDGHIMSPRDPNFSAKPIIEEGPYTSAQRDAFLAGNSAGTKLAPHHRHQIPVRDGGVIDEIPGPGHPSGNQHTAGTPSRHPAGSVFNKEPGGNALRANEIKQHWKNKGQRLIERKPGVWIDPGF